MSSYSSNDSGRKKNLKYRGLTHFSMFISHCVTRFPRYKVFFMCVCVSETSKSTPLSMSAGLQDLFNQIIESEERTQEQKNRVNKRIVRFN